MSAARIRAGMATRAEIIKTTIDPFNGGAGDRDELRAFTCWRVIAGGKPLTAVRLFRHEIERRRKNIEIVRRHYSADAATRLERELVADVRAAAGDRAALLLCRGRP